MIISQCLTFLLILHEKKYFWPTVQWNRVPTFGSPEEMSLEYYMSLRKKTSLPECLGKLEGDFLFTFSFCKEYMSVEAFGVNCY